jgi:hypothetical protein
LMNKGGDCYLSEELRDYFEGRMNLIKFLTGSNGWYF